MNDDKQEKTTEEYTELRMENKALQEQVERLRKQLQSASTNEQVQELKNRVESQDAYIRSLLVNQVKTMSVGDWAKINGTSIVGRVEYVMIDRAGISYLLGWYDRNNTKQTALIHQDDLESQEHLPIRPSLLAENP